jgi:hypothetical protein
LSHFIARTRSLRLGFESGFWRPCSTLLIGALHGPCHFQNFAKPTSSCSCELLPTAFKKGPLSAKGPGLRRYFSSCPFSHVIHQYAACDLDPRSPESGTVSIHVKISQGCPSDCPPQVRFYSHSSYFSYSRDAPKFVLRQLDRAS